MWVVILSLIQPFSNLSLAYSMTLENVDIPLEATEYAYEHYEEVLQVIKEYIDWYNVTEEQLINAKLGEPFVIYELNETIQDEIYYYPILDSQNNIILLMSVMGTTEGWSASISEEWVMELNEIDYISSDYIFYKSEDNLYAENKRDEFCVTGEVDSNIESFSEKTYYAKVKVIEEAIDKFVKVDVSCSNATDTELEDMYAPAFSSSSSSSKMCKLYNAQEQGKYMICWAATVATICNYLKGTNITAMEIAEEMNIGNAGASVYQSQRALNWYGIRYQQINTDINNRMTWTELKYNINDKYPIYVSSVTSDGKYGHAVTLYGYMIAAGVRYVVLWNPGTGSSMTVPFSESGKTFTYDNNIFT